MNILVSSCLLGEDVRYDASNNKITALESLLKKHEVFSFCPEVQGGLLTPRSPAEKQGIKVITDDGIDVTLEFEKGALEALNLCKEHNITHALLKANSPSCGNIQVYDGTFSKTLVNGAGVCAKLLLENKIKVFNENELAALEKELNF